MSKKAPFLTEIALGLVLTGLVSFFYHTRSPLLESMSLKSYDLFASKRKIAAKTSDIYIVEIDENSTKNIGRWPWSRAIQAQLIDEIVAGGAKVIGLNILYGDADQNQGLEEVGQLHENFKALLAQSKPIFKRKGISAAPFEEFLANVENVAADLNGDAILARSIEEAGNVVLPMLFVPGEPLGNNIPDVPQYFAREKLNLGGAGAVPQAQGFDMPLDAFGAAAVAAGHCNLYKDVDGAVRQMEPVMKLGGGFYPSFGVQVVREFLDLPRDAVSAQGPTFAMGNARIPADEYARAYIDFAGPAGTFPRTSALDVLTGAVPENIFNNKIVLVGTALSGNADVFQGPAGESYTGLEIWANHIENVLARRFVTRPAWARQAEWGSIILAGLIVMLGLPLLRARFSIPMAGLAFSALLLGSGFLFVKQGLWFSSVYGAFLLLSGFAVIVGKRLIFTERGKEMVEAEGVETNKMLGLSFQGQGLFDLAFEKFRKCPVDGAIKELLYNLGLDMERKRQFSKAAAVYEHISTVDPAYKDITAKIELLKKAGEGAVFGSIGKKGNDATVVVEGLGQHTTLGRYEVMKELGRGAMGIVYLGKDPKINRAVAIKTLRFEEAADEEQTKSIKERFFREAESAGNLTHPNIIRIFDAGEDQDVAYIAMELLEGVDLKKYCEKANLFPMSRTLDIIAQIADGLDYAHKQGVVHRDIKPGNIMLLKDDTLRITDFGIARIQATSKTATGAVLGTPAYMSPEQVNGKKVDGRADIFSLGVTLYELLTGEKPFHADSIAALLYRIANVDHPDPREFNTSVPPDVVAILKKALAKDPANRYQNAGELSADIRACIKRLSNEPVQVSGNSMKEQMDAESVAADSATRTPETAPTPYDVNSKPTAPAPAATNGSAPATPVETAAPAVFDRDFYSELEKAFNVSSPASTEAPVEAPTPRPEIDKTVVEEVGMSDTPDLHPAIESTVVLEPTDPNRIEPPLVNGIEHGFQPPSPTNDSKL